MPENQTEQTPKQGRSIKASKTNQPAASRTAKKTSPKASRTTRKIPAAPSASQAGEQEKLWSGNMPTLSEQRGSSDVPMSAGGIPLGPPVQLDSNGDPVFQDSGPIYIYEQLAREAAQKGLPHKSPPAAPRRPMRRYAAAGEAAP